MKRILALSLILFILAACVPTPEEEFVINKGDGTFEELISTTSAPTAAQAATLEEEEEAQQSDFPRRWKDRIELNYVTVEFDASIEMNDGPHPIRKVKRHSFTAEEVNRIAEEMLPNVTAVWNSTAYSRQEYLQGIASLTSLGMTDIAQIQYQIMSEADDLENEAFDSTDRIVWTEETPMQTYLCENDKYATVVVRNSAVLSFLTISTARHALIQSAELLRDVGHYENMEPVNVNPSITDQEAEEAAYAFLERMGLRGYRICKAEPASYFSDICGVEYSQGWHLYLYNANEYIALDMGNRGANGIFEFDDGQQYSMPWYGESMTIYVSEYGVEQFSWTCPVNIVEITNPDVQLLNFETLQKRIKNMLSAGLSWIGSYYEGRHYDWNGCVSRLVLTQALIPVKNEPDAAYLMPVWAVVTDWYTAFDDRYEVTGYTCFNAVDGSPVSLMPSW